MTAKTPEPAERKPAGSGSQKEPKPATTEPGPVTSADIQALIAVIREGMSKSDCTKPCEPKPCEPEGKPEGGSVENALALSVFSELVYSLRTHGSIVGIPAQKVPVEVNADGELVFPKEPPAFAETVVVVHRGGVNPDQDLPVPGKNMPIDVYHPETVVAVRLKDCNGEVRMVSFVTNNYVADEPDPCSYGPYSYATHSAKTS
ncbi:hypothetical protein [Rhodococcus tukisamuensis]|uniref:Uncharacterized protein n=1 Tax=Rhodococcus tukisamuensis TaxID=168276 RepID=A0A1G6RFN4_9NOCA|nr:hypothetical protein [Rhodococcus tukisamuensis]SDD02696.1 hypothetical protein SAMN05444580_102433 [Rhodococcus tukisamuensis]